MNRSGRLPVFCRAALAAACAALVLAAFAPAALADEYDDDSGYDSGSWPLRTTKRPLVLAPGMTEIKGDLVIDMSTDRAFDGIAAVPSLMYGVNRNLTIGVDHEQSLCLKGCDKTYNDIGLVLLYSLMGKGSVQLAGQTGLRVPSFDPFGLGVEAGIDLRISAGTIALRTEPLFYFGIAKRDEVRKDTLEAPVWLQLQVNEQTEAFLRTGISGNLSGFGDAYIIPVGIGATFAASNRVDFGAEFAFTNLAGKGGSGDGRVLIGRIAFRI